MAFYVLMNTGKVRRSNILCCRTKTVILQTCYSSLSQNFAEIYCINSWNGNSCCIAHSVHGNRKSNCVLKYISQSLTYWMRTNTISLKMNWLYQDVVVAMIWTCQYLQAINMPHKTHTCIYFWTVSKSCHLYTSLPQILHVTNMHTSCSLSSHTQRRWTTLTWFINWVC